MRILHIGKFYPPFAGGMENFLGDLLPALSRQGIDATALVHSSPGAPVHNSSSDVKVHRVPCYGTVLFAPVSPGFPFQFAKAIAQIKPDIIHMHMPNTSALWALLLPNASTIPWVIHWHSDVVSTPECRQLSAAYVLYRPLEQRLLVRADKVIVTSQRYLESSSSLKPWRHKCTVIPLGLEPDRLPLSIQSNPQHLLIQWKKQKQLRVLAIGRLTYYKGHDVLIRAAAATDGVQVIIAGRGNRQHALEQLIKELHVEDKVFLAGLLPDKELQALLSTADCFCLPSIERTEAFGLVLLEAMRYGKAILASDVPGSGIGWIVQHEKTGSLFKSGSVDELAQLLHYYALHPEERIARGEAGKKRFESRFNIHQVAADISCLYHQIIST